MHDRTIRSRRRGLNPTKIVFVYCLAMILVCFHQAGRVADWFEDLGLGREGLVSELSFEAAAFFRQHINPWGPSQLNRVENWVLARTPGSAIDRTPPGQPRPEPPAGPGPIRPGRIAGADSDQPFPPGSESGTDKRLPGERPSEPQVPWVLDARAILPTPPSNEELMASLRPMARPDDPALVFNPARVLLLGDSMMLEGLGPPLQRELKKNKGLAVFRDGEYGTGLVRPDKLDWSSFLDQMMDKYQPDLVILTLGANDTQDMVEEGRRLAVGGQEWTERYAQRVANLLARAEARRVRVFWVGLPIMGQEPYGTRANHINKVVDAVCRVTANCSYWDSRLAVADARGQFAAFLPDEQGKSVRVRSKDSIHLTEVGGRIMAEKFLAETAVWADYNQDTRPEPDSGPSGSGETRPLAPSAGEADDDDDEPVGRLTRHQFFSKLRGREVSYLVAAPEPAAGPLMGPRGHQGSTERSTLVRRPLVLLLHGAWDGYGVWAERLGPGVLARLAAERGLILVMPDGEPFGWYLDGRETAIESYLMTELLPRVLGERPEADPERLGAVGLSMGGHGALTLALKHPETFKAVGSISGVTDLSTHLGRHEVDSELKIDRVLGPPGPEGQNWRPHSALGLTRQNPDRLAGRPLMLSVGTGDRLTLAENRAYHELLTRLEIDHIYLEEPGGHDWDYWAAQLPAHLNFMVGKLKAGGGK